MEPRRVVVTGLGALTPIGNTLPEYWEGLISGTSGAAPITYFDASKFKTQFACELSGKRSVLGQDLRIGWHQQHIVEGQRFAKQTHGMSPKTRSYRHANQVPKRLDLLFRQPIKSNTAPIFSMIALITKFSPRALAKENKA